MNNPGSHTGDAPDQPRSKAPLPASDGRSSEARKHKVLVADILSYLRVDDYGQLRTPTEAERALANRAAALLMRLEVFNEKIIAAEPYDIPEHLSIHKMMLAALDALGITPLKPKPRRH